MEAPPLPIAVPNPNRFTETDHCSVYYLDLIDDRYWLTNIRTLLGPTPIRCPFTPLYFRAFLPLCTLADVPPSHPPSLLPHTLSKAEPRGGHPTPPQAYISLGATQSRTLQTPRNRTKTPGQSPIHCLPGISTHSSKHVWIAFLPICTPGGLRMDHVGSTAPEPGPRSSGTGS